MTWQLSEIYRHPVKSLGEEALEEADLTKGRPMPFDRRWAIAHDGAEAIGGWAHCRNFVTQRNVPRLAQLGVSFSQRNNMLHLSHPDLESLALQVGTPDGDDALTEWIAPLTEGTVTSGPFLVYEIPDVAFTDGQDCHISVASVPSRRALSELAGVDLQPIRFRMNLWLDGGAPWEEMDWAGRELEVGDARLKLLHRCERCNSTNANPTTGKRDTQIPALLREQFGHMDFGLNAQVLSGGTVRRGDSVRLI